MSAAACWLITELSLGTPVCASYSVFSPLEIFPSHDMSHLTHWAPTHCVQCRVYSQWWGKYEPRTQELIYVSLNDEILNLTFSTCINIGSLIVSDERKEEMILKVEPRPFRPTCYSYEETCPVLPDAACSKCQRMCSYNCMAFLQLGNEMHCVTSHDWCGYHPLRWRYLCYK